MIGLESTFDEHLTNLVAVFREVRRVLRKDGTLWLNYGDAYANDGKWGGSTGGKHAAGLHGQTGIGRQKVTTGLKPKDLMLMPARVAMALQSDGWWLRSEIVWHKPNPMPESVTDRPTSAHEKLFLLSKSARYFYDAEAVRQGLADNTQRPTTGGGVTRHGNGSPDSGIGAYQDKVRSGEVSGANLRNVWTIPTHGYSEAHFATFPPALVEPCIKAGTSERGVCAECGAPWERVVEETPEYKAWRERQQGLPRHRWAAREAHQGAQPLRGAEPGAHHRLAPHLRPRGGDGAGCRPRSLWRQRHRGPRS